MRARRLAFQDLPWQQADGARSKACTADGARMRLLEFGPAMPHPDWCLEGHWAYVLEGEMTLELADCSIRLSAGDGLYVPPGEAARHRPHALSALVRLLLVERDPNAANDISKHD